MCVQVLEGKENDVDEENVLEVTVACHQQTEDLSLPKIGPLFIRSDVHNNENFSCKREHHEQKNFDKNPHAPLLSFPGPSNPIELLKVVPVVNKIFSIYKWLDDDSKMCEEQRKVDKNVIDLPDWRYRVKYLIMVDWNIEN